MSIKPENQFIQGVHKYLHPNLYSMKNHNVYVGGVPDVWYSGDARDLWIEYKFKRIGKPTKVITPDLSPMQARWIDQRQQEGRVIWVILGISSGGVIYEMMHEMIHGLSPIQFMARLLSRRDLAEMISMHCMKSGSKPLTLMSNVGVMI